MSESNVIDNAVSQSQDKAALAVVASQAAAFALSTSDRKGNRVSFERSIAFAGKDARLKLSTTVYQTQVCNGAYGPLLHDAISALCKVESATMLMDGLRTAGRNPSKDAAKTVCGQLMSIIGMAKKPLKGQKAFYAQLIGILSTELNKAE
jgi:hypothetical protein